MNDSSKGLRLLVMSDTHVPKRAKELPAALWSAVAEADVVIHAGDWVDAALLDALALLSEDTRPGEVITREYADYGEQYDPPSVKAK